MSFLPADPLNCEIIALSLGLQREISKDAGPEGPEIGAQQVMPMPGHVDNFGPKNPLPWVPDRVGIEFSRENQGVLVVGSSYNGFIEGYSKRSMRLADYLAIRDLIREGNEDPAHPKVAEACSIFIHEFERQVMAPDHTTYYGPICHDLLQGISLSKVCLTDVCKASYVRRGEFGNGRTRKDKGGDLLISEHIGDFAKYVTCILPTEAVMPLPYEWLWRRIQQCCHIIALGILAEYGVLKIFQRMGIVPQITTRNGGRISKNLSLAAVAPWKYCYADSNRKPSYWLSNKDWWILGDGKTGQKWNLLPVYHPAAHPPYADRGYVRSTPALVEMRRGLERSERPPILT